MPGVYRKLADTWRRDGLTGIVKKVGDRLFAHATYVLLECAIGEHPTRPPVRSELSFSWVAVDDLDRFRQHELAATDQSKRISAERLIRGDRCAAGYVEGRPVSSLWLTSQQRELPNRRLAVGARNVFVYKTFTIPEARGQGFHRLVLLWALTALRDEGFVRAFVDIEDNNIASLRPVRSVGFTEIGRFHTYTIAGLTITTVPKRLAERVAGSN